MRASERAFDGEIKEPKKQCVAPRRLFCVCHTHRTSSELLVLSFCEGCACVCACVEGRWGGWAELNQLQFITDFSRRRADQGDEDELSGTESVRTGLSATSPPLVCGGGSGGVGIGGRLFKVAIRRALLETRSHGGGRDGGGGSFAQRIVLGFPFVLESFFPPSPSFHPSWFTRSRREEKCAATS